MSRGRPVVVRERAVEGVLERGQTLDRGAEIGEADVAVDEEIHRAVDVRERVGRLIEAAEVDDFGKVERRDDHIGNDDGNLAVELVEGDEPGAHMDDATDGSHDLAEHAAGPVDLALLALEERDLFAVFADAREIEAEVRLDRLLAEIEPGQASADELGDARRDAGVEDRDPEQKAGDLQAEDRRLQRVGDPPQDDRERDQIGRRGDRLDGVIVDADVAGIDAGAGAVDEAADVLRDALVGVVGRDVLAWELFRYVLVRMRRRR